MKSPTKSHLRVPEVSHRLAAQPPNIFAPVVGPAAPVHAPRPSRLVSLRPSGSALLELVKYCQTSIAVVIIGPAVCVIVIVINESHICISRELYPLLLIFLYSLSCESAMV